MKVLAKIEGQSMLSRVVKRVMRSQFISEVVVATTTSTQDEQIIKECESLGVPFFRGSEEDVLGRYFETAKQHNIDVVVRVTSDCPLIDSQVIDQVIEMYQSANVDYVSNVLERTYPRGLDVEVFSTEALRRAHELATETHHRIHVTPFIYENPNEFKLKSVTAKQDQSHFRWTVDTEDDLDLVREIYRALGDRDDFLYQDILDVVLAHPEWLEINSHIAQKELKEG